MFDGVPLVGGKNASLGELYSTLSSEGVRLPNGFALTAAAYRDAIVVRKIELLDHTYRNFQREKMARLALFDQMRQSVEALRCTVSSQR